MKIDESKLNKHLSGIAKLVFLKDDGTIRVMRCTNNLNLIPSYLHPKSGRTYVVGTKRVFDIDLGEWRTFRTSSVITIEPLKTNKRDK